MNRTDAPDGVPNSVPAWVQDAVFYQIFPDRFAMSDAVPKPANLEPWGAPPTIHGFKGGDLRGIAEKLDYLLTLGITALYLCPIFQSTANHRYHTYDYYSIDPILGGDGAFQYLLDAAHARSMRVVLDGVFNHCSRGFFQFNHILENGASSPYLDWFTVFRWPLAPYGPAGEDIGYWAWWGNPALPKFNTNTQAVREYLWGVGEYWVRRGIDGWRLDVPNEIDDDAFWREFRTRVKSVNPEAYIVGEIWGDATRWLQGDQFDAVMNYPFTKAALGFFGARNGLNSSAIGGTGLDPVTTLNAEEFASSIDGLVRRYPEANTRAQLNLLDSHDTARFLTLACGDESALRLAMLFQYTFVGAPCTYYGDEIGMTSNRTVEDARAGFNWDAGTWNTGLLEHVRACIALRRNHHVFSRGAFESLYAGSGVYAFARRDADDLALIAFNTSGAPVTIEIPRPAGTSLESLQRVWGGGTLSATESGNVAWNLEPRWASVYVQ